MVGARVLWRERVITHAARPNAWRGKKVIQTKLAVCLFAKIFREKSPAFVVAETKYLKITKCAEIEPTIKGDALHKLHDSDYPIGRLFEELCLIRNRSHLFLTLAILHSSQCTTPL